MEPSPTATSEEPTAAPTPAPTATATIPTPTPSLGKIQTPDGQYSVTKVELGDRFPLDCSPPTTVISAEGGCLIGPPDCSSCTQRLKEGYQILAIWLESLEGGERGALSEEIQHGCDSGVIYVAAGDGSQTNCLYSGLFEGRFFVCFTPPVSAHDFELFWSDNPPIDLGE